MRLMAVVAVIMLSAGAVFFALDMTALVQWAAERQREFQNAMAGAIRGLRTGQPGAWSALLAAAVAYGFVHAVGPGHGKYLIGGLGLGSSVSTTRLVTIALLSSLAQALWAVTLVYGGFSLLSYTAHQLTAFTETVLAPISYLAVALVGLMLFWRGLRSFLSRDTSWRRQDHGHCSGCGHAHAPAPEDVAKLTSLSDTVALIASVAIRPCTGAIFLLIIAWQMDIKLAGAVATIAMGLGTAGLTTMVAVSSVAARGVTLASAKGLGTVSTALSALQAVSGVLIIWFSMLLFGVAVRV